MCSPAKNTVGTIADGPEHRRVRIRMRLGQKFLVARMFARIKVDPGASSGVVPFHPGPVLDVEHVVANPGVEVLEAGQDRLVLLVVAQSEMNRSAFTPVM